VFNFGFLKVIAAEGEHKASRALKDAADILSESSSAIQLRYLQTVNIFFIN
jgi:erythrocyte band 7 integral membrane protein